MGGRWIRPGTPVAYASPSKALAILEYLANVDASTAPEDLTDRTSPLVNRDAIGSHTAKAHGELWVAAHRSAVLAVPSVVVPGEENYVISPQHPDFPRVCVHPDVEGCVIDSRFVE